MCLCKFRSGVIINLIHINFIFKGEEKETEMLISLPMVAVQSLTNPCLDEETGV